MRRWMPDVPIMLCRLKTDLDDEASVNPAKEEDPEKSYSWSDNPTKRYTNSYYVSVEQGEAMAKKLGIPHMSCSALTGKGVKEMFDEGVRMGLAYAKVYPTGTPTYDSDFWNHTNDNTPVVFKKRAGPRPKERKESRCGLM